MNRSGFMILEPELIDEMQTEYDRWLQQGGDHFTGGLFRLIIKADPINTYKLAQGFPYEVYVVCKHHGKPGLRRFIESEDGKICMI